MSQTVHVLPVGDLIEHEDEGTDCVCAPTVEPVPDDDGSMGWLIVHHSLDGREHAEPDHDRTACPRCSESA
jgi:hypothetical protein